MFYKITRSVKKQERFLVLPSLLIAKREYTHEISCGGRTLFISIIIARMNMTSFDSLC
jgi:hypothetical protein